MKVHGHAIIKEQFGIEWEYHTCSYTWCVPMNKSTKELWQTKQGSYYIHTYTTSLIRHYIIHIIHPSADVLERYGRNASSLTVLRINIRVMSDRYCKMGQPANTSL